jgi:hypothetical protein
VRETPTSADAGCPCGMPLELDHGTNQSVLHRVEIWSKPKRADAAILYKETCPSSRPVEGYLANQRFTREKEDSEKDVP